MSGSERKCSFILGEAECDDDDSDDRDQDFEDESASIDDMDFINDEPDDDEEEEPAEGDDERYSIDLLYVCLRLFTFPSANQDLHNR